MFFCQKEMWRFSRVSLIFQILFHILSVCVQWRARSQEESDVTQQRGEAARQRDRQSGRVRGPRPVQVQRGWVVHRSVRRPQEEQRAYWPGWHHTVSTVDVRIATSLTCLPTCSDYLVVGVGDDYCDDDDDDDDDGEMLSVIVVVCVAASQQPICQLVSDFSCRMVTFCSGHSTVHCSVWWWLRS